MLLIMIDGLSGGDESGILAERSPGVGIPVDIGKGAARDGDPDPVTDFENMTRVHQVDLELINLARNKKLLFELGLSIASPKDAR
jgi:hypothetical protein